MYWIIGIVALVLTPYVISIICGARRGIRIAQHLYVFTRSYEDLVAAGALREDALFAALQTLKSCPRFRILTDADLKMVSEVLSPLREPHKVVERIVFKADSSKAPHMLRDREFMTKAMQIKLRAEDREECEPSLGAYSSKAADGPTGNAQE